MPKTQNNKNIRENIAKDYGRAITDNREQHSNSGCCCKNKKPLPKGVVAKLAGYNDEELAALPKAAIINSFGCGNPLAFSAVKPGQTVLDLGSGAGIDLLLAARKVGPKGKVIGVDMTPEMIAKARENIANSGISNIEVRSGLIEALPVADNSVDWVISNCVINLSPEKERVFKEIMRVLRPGGQMLVADIVAEFLPKEIAENPKLHSSCLAGAISEKTYIQKLQNTGFININILDRLIYDASQLKAFIGSELETETKSTCCCNRKNLAETFAAELQGKVWSIKITAAKPT